MIPSYDANDLQRRYDALGKDQLNYYSARGARGELTRRLLLGFLVKFTEPGQTVLDAGSGPGALAIELALRGRKLTLFDISSVQIEIARQEFARSHVSADDLVVGDITNMRAFPSSRFDVTICVGGALSHVLNNAEDALSELARVTKRGGYMICSVMSRSCEIDEFNSIMALENTEIESALPRCYDAMMQRVGTYESIGSFMKYSVEELTELLGQIPLIPIQFAAIERHHIHEEFSLQEVMKSKSAWEALVDFEANTCVLPWILESGNQILAITRRPKRG